MSEIFSNLALVYDALYQDKNYSEEAEYFCGLIQKWQPFEVKKVLELGAGTGKFQAEFKRRGFDVEGIDLSPQMVSVARAAGHNVRIADARFYEHYEEIDLVMALFHVVSYVTSDEDLELLFSKVSDNLRPGGLFIFDVWFSEAVLAQNPEVRIKRARSGQTEIIRLSEPQPSGQANVVKVLFTLFTRTLPGSQWLRSEELHEMRHFLPNDLEKLAARSGLRILKIEETISGEHPSPSSWGVTTVARKEP